jgi:biopolymer transport protein ExbB/TolQ
MSTTAIVLIVIAAIVVVALIAYAATLQRTKRLEQRRVEAQDVRTEAQAKTRRAEQARLAAEEQAERARRDQQAAAELHEKANDIDPDVDDADQAPARGTGDGTTADADGYVRVRDVDG